MMVTLIFAFVAWDFTEVNASCGATTETEHSRTSARNLALVRGDRVSPLLGWTTIATGGSICLLQPTLAVCLTGRLPTGSSTITETALSPTLLSKQALHRFGRPLATPGVITTTTDFRTCFCRMP